MYNPNFYASNYFQLVVHLIYSLHYVDWLKKLRINAQKKLIMCNGNETRLDSNLFIYLLELEV